MASKNKENADMETILSSQIPEYSEEPQVVAEQHEEQKTGAAQFLGTRIGHTPGKMGNEDKVKAEDSTLADRKKLSRVGDNIFEKAEFREGYINVDRALLGDRNQFYPESWKFKIRPATVEAIRNWSMIQANEDNPSAMDDVFNEIIKCCLSIEDGVGNPIPWNRINSWDRFFFILLIREYTYKTGEAKLEWDEECVNCDSLIKFSLNSQAMMYDIPDPDIMSYYNPDNQTWVIDPAEFDIEGEDILELHLPTLEKDANIKAWMVDKLQKNRNAKIDPVFIRCLSWMAPKISKDINIAIRQIREYEYKFKNWDIDMFSFVDGVIRNIAVTPSQNIKTICPSCGEEVTSPIRFPDGVNALFSVGNKHKKFGKK